VFSITTFCQYSEPVSGLGGIGRNGVVVFLRSIGSNGCDLFALFVLSDDVFEFSPSTICFAVSREASINLGSSRSQVVKGRCRSKRPSQEHPVIIIPRKLSTLFTSFIRVLLRARHLTSTILHRNAQTTFRKVTILDIFFTKGGSPN